MAEDLPYMYRGESVPVYDGIPLFGSPHGSFFQIV